MIILKDNIWRPESDQGGVNLMVTENWIPKFIVDSCTELKIPLNNVVHAGGNIGLYALEFAKYFKNVYTFEPENDNFSALCLNCANVQNIFPYKAVLGNSHTPVSLKNQDETNCGTWQVVDGKNNIPMFQIDDLNMEVNVIHLDIEGFEIFALSGAIQTIKKYRPLIAFEDLGHSRTYNYVKADIDKFLVDLGYNMSRTYASEIMYYHGENN